MQFSPAVVLAVSRAPYPKQLIHYQLLVLLSEKLRNPSSTWCLSSGKSTCMRISSAYFLSLKLSFLMSDKALLKLLSSLPTLSSFLACSKRATACAESWAPASTHRPRPQRYRLPCDPKPFSKQCFLQHHLPSQRD